MEEVLARLSDEYLENDYIWLYVRTHDILPKI